MFWTFPLIVDKILHAPPLYAYFTPFCIHNNSAPLTFPAHPSIPYDHSLNSSEHGQKNYMILSGHQRERRALRDMSPSYDVCERKLNRSRFVCKYRNIMHFIQVRIEMALFGFRTTGHSKFSFTSISHDRDTSPKAFSRNLIFKNYYSSPNGLWVNSPRGRNSRKSE